MSLASPDLFAWQKRGLGRLDKAGLLGFGVWDFAWHSLSTEYGRIFAQRWLLRKPLRALRGLLAYRRERRARGWGVAVVGAGSAQGLLWRALHVPPAQVLVGLGFCLKPRPEDGAPCPSGRFTHHCAALEGERARGPFPLPCQACTVGRVGQAARRAGASLAVLTSAADIARDILLPAAEDGRFRVALMALCPYSVEPMALAFHLCGLQGLLFPFAEGACATYRQWRAADLGDKPERTALTRDAEARLTSWLEDLAALRWQQGQGPLDAPYALVQDVLVPAAGQEEVRP
ncbi:MAG: hypothetical protein H5T59_08710 [Anaerolineae bacterium]|nr:hypothetical protein [Anaerolineae bacterium]